MGGLRRELNVLEAAALSVAIMAPTAAMAFNVAGAAASGGERPTGAVALAFLLAAVTVALVSFSFVTFARRYASAGSVYTFNGKALGAPVGFLSGWLLLATYAAFSVASSAEVGLFVQTVVALLGGEVAWLWPTLVVLVVITLFGINRVSVSTKTALVVEGVSIALIAVLAVIIFIHAPDAGSARPFVPHEVSLSAVGLASVFAFLSFAGFEGAATLGEETARPRRAIPRALVTAVVTMSVFYLVISYAQAVGFGVGASGVAELAGSSAPLADLSLRYADRPLAVAIMMGATVSAFASALGTTTAAARLLFTMGRDRLLPVRLAALHGRTGAPRAAVLVIAVTALACDAALYATGASAAEVFSWLGALGVLALLPVYLVTQIGAIRLFRGTGQWRAYVLVVPVLAVACLAYVLYANVYPVPAAPVRYLPYVVIAWIVLGAAVAAVRPGPMRAVARELAESAAE